MRFPKTISRILAAGLALSLLSGCTPISHGGPFQGKSLVMQGEDEIPLTCSWWGNDVRHQYTLAGLDLFEEAHPELSVTPSYGIWEGYERRYRVFMKSHTNADVMQINFSWLETYSPDGSGYYDLRDLADVVDLTQFREEDLEMGSRGGHLNGLPTAYNSSVFFYNQDLFDRYGLALPRTWDDLFTAAEAMRADGVYPLGLVKKHLFLMLCARYEQMYGKKLYSEDGRPNATKEELEEMVVFYKRLVDEQVIPRLDDFNNADFTSEKLAGVCCWISDVNRYCQSLSDTGTAVVQGDYPAFTPGEITGWYIKPASMLAISADTLHPKEAGLLLQFLIGDPDMARLAGTEKGVPVNALAYETLKEENLLSGLETGATEHLNKVKGNMDAMLPILENADLIDGFKSETDKCIYEEESPKECAENLLQLLNEIGA